MVDMEKSTWLVLGIMALVFSLCSCNISKSTYGQIVDTKPSAEKTSEAGENVVSVNSKVSVQVRNETLQVKEKMLRSAVFSFLNSGPTILKTSESDQLITKTKVVNQINNATQSVEGIEASNAIIGVEIGKALRTLVSSQNNSTNIGTIILGISSTCKPASALVVSCDNTISINR